MSADLFSVCQFFVDGGYEYVRRHVPAEDAAKAARHYTASVAAKMGMVERVIITDIFGCACFEWTKADGITFPPVARGRGKLETVR